MKTLVVALVLLSAQAQACNRFHPDPFDRTCTMDDINRAGVMGHTQFYAENPYARRSMIYSCQHSYLLVAKPRPYECQAAMSAEVAASRGYR